MIISLSPIKYELFFGRVSATSPARVTLAKAKEIHGGNWASRNKFAPAGNGKLVHCSFATTSMVNKNANTVREKVKNKYFALRFPVYEIQ
jgi:hypothetical protein